MSPGQGREPVTVIGLGPMGQAMASSFLDGGHPVTVFNRTASRGDGLVARGARGAATAREAVEASELVVLSLTDYQAMYDLLDASGDALAGRVIANLSSDTPQRTRDAAAWAAQHRAVLLAGGVMVPAPVVGTDAAYVFYSGPRSSFDAHEATLRVIGRPDYRGEDPGLAQLYYQAQLDIFLTCLSGYLHATALIGTAGVSAEDFLPYAIDNFDALSSYLPAAARMIDEGLYPGDLANVTMMGATAGHIVEASRSAGVDLALPTAVQQHYDHAIAAGRGGEDFSSLIEVIRPTTRGGPQ